MEGYRCVFGGWSSFCAPESGGGWCSGGRVEDAAAELNAPSGYAVVRVFVVVARAIAGLTPSSRKREAVRADRCKVTAGDRKRAQVHHRSPPSSAGVLFSRRTVTAAVALGHLVVPACHAAAVDAGQLAPAEWRAGEALLGLLVMVLCVIGGGVLSDSRQPMLTPKHRAEYEQKVLDRLGETNPEHASALGLKLTPEQEQDDTIAEVLKKRQRTPAQEHANARAAAEITHIAAAMDQAPESEREPARFPDGDAYWDWYDGQLIEEELQRTLLVDLEYHVLLARYGGVLPCGLQHVPPAALITKSNLWRVKLWNKRRSKAAIGVLAYSYPWLDWFHPDSDGAQLRRNLPFLEAMLAEAKHDSPFCTVAVMIDCQSLFQRPFASELVSTLFTGSLTNVNLWYYHQYTYVLLITNAPPEGGAYGNTRLHKERGWCFFELAASTVVKRYNCLLDLGGYQGAYAFCDKAGATGYEPLPNTCLGEMIVGPGRQPPMSPPVMAERMRAGVEDETLKFTANADMDKVIQQFEAGFKAGIDRVAAKEHKHLRFLDFARLDWGDGQAAELLETLRYAAAHCAFPCGAVKVYILKGNNISPEMKARFKEDDQLQGKFVLYERKFLIKKAGFLGNACSVM